MEYKDKSVNNINFEISYLKLLSETPTSAVTIHHDYKGKLAILPFHLGYIKQAVKVLLDAKVSLYDVELDGIILGFNNIKVFNSAYHSDNPKLFLDYTADVYLFRPTIKCALKGIVNKMSPEHIGCLVNRAFNASICKPEEKDLIDNWEKIHSTVQLGEPITFTVTHINFASRLPCINGSFSSPSENEVDDQNLTNLEKEESTTFYDPASISDLLVNCKKNKSSKKRKLKQDVSINDISLSPPKKKKKKSLIDYFDKNEMCNGSTTDGLDGSQNSIINSAVKNCKPNEVSPKKLSGVVNEEGFNKKKSNCKVKSTSPNNSTVDNMDDSRNYIINSAMNSFSSKKELEEITVKEEDILKKAFKKKKKSHMDGLSNCDTVSKNVYSSAEENLNDSRNSIINSAMERLFSKKVDSPSAKEKVRNIGESDKFMKKKSISVFDHNGEKSEKIESPLKSKKVRQSSELNIREIQSDLDISKLTKVKKKRKSKKSGLNLEELKSSIIADKIFKLSI